MGGPGNERNWVNHPYLKDGAVGKIGIKAHFLQETHAQSAPEEQVFRE